MLRVAVCALAACLFAVSAISAERAVEAKAGNIFLSESGGQSRQLTSSGRDSSPVFSPDGNWIVFVRAGPEKKISTGNDEVDAGELWQIDVDGKQPTLLVRPRESEKPEEMIAGFDDLQFSADGRLVYFVSSAWATSGAVHVIDLTTAKERFVLPGNDLEVMQTGKYRDCLLVRQHRYFLGAGSFDWFWLFRLDGTEVGPVGEETENFKKLYGK